MKNNFADFGLVSEAQAVDMLYLHEIFHDLFEKEGIIFENIDQEELVVSGLAKEKVGIVLNADETKALEDFRANTIIRNEVIEVVDFSALKRENIGTIDDEIGSFMLTLQRASPGAAFDNVEDAMINSEFLAGLSRAKF